MTRWLAAIAFALLVIAAGLLVFLNPEPVTIRYWSTRTISAPLASVLLVAFATGAGLVGAFAAARAGARGWRAWRARRAARRAAREAEATARAQQLVWKGDYAQARAEILRAEGDAPSDATRLELLAEAYLLDGDPAAARRILEDGLTRLGPSPRLLDLLADAAERAGDLGAAAAALERARAALPDSPRIARRLRDTYVAAERWGDALGVQGQILLGLRSADALAAEEERLRGLRYQHALADPEPRRAGRLLVALGREHPTFVPAWVSAGEMFVRAGRAATARRAWERGARRAPAVILLERIEQQNASEGRAERTTRFLRRLQKRHPTSPAVALMVARHLITKGDLDGAATLLAELPAAIAALPQAHALWGDLHRRRGNHDIAANSFAEAWTGAWDPARRWTCRACHTPHPAWDGYCRTCRRWGTIAAELEPA
jgi:tetratricopeptide (TPR) repeat protein